MKKVRKGEGKREGGKGSSLLVHSLLTIGAGSLVTDD